MGFVYVNTLLLTLTAAATRGKPTSDSSSGRGSWDGGDAGRAADQCGRGGDVHNRDKEKSCYFELHYDTFANSPSLLVLYLREMTVGHRTSTSFTDDTTSSLSSFSSRR